MTPRRISFFPWPCGRCLCVGLLIAASAACSLAAARPPNILLITADDLGFQLGCYGDKVVTTPNIDRMAAEGVRFDDFYVTASSCSPSRASLLTGLYPHQNGQLGLAHLGSSMHPGLPNLPALLRKQGYRTGLVGKLHVEPEGDFPFDYKKNDIEPTRDPRAVRAMCDEFFGQGDKEPFFLYLNLFDPHSPFLRDVAGSPRVKVDADQAGVLPFVGSESPALRQETADYLTCVNRLDEIMGQVAASLRAHGLDEKTVVIFLSDNGPEFPRGKCTSFEAGTRVPMIVRWSGRFDPRVSRELVSEVDVLPTVLQLADVAAPAALPGRSLLPVLEGEPAEWRTEIFTEYNSHEPRMFDPQRAVRSGRYKLIRTLLRDPGLEWPGALDLEKFRAVQSRAGQGDFTQLYDLESDPHEFKNLAGSRALAAEQERLIGALADWRRGTKDPLLDAEKLRHLVTESMRALETGVVLGELHRKQAAAREAGLELPNTVTPAEMDLLRAKQNTESDAEENAGDGR